MQADNVVPVSVEELSLEEVTRPIRIDGKDYLIVEADSETAVSFRNIVLSKVTMENKKISGLSGIASAEPYLVSQCLKRLDKDGKRLPVGITEINGWKSRVVKRVYEIAREISGLKEDEDDKPKN